MKKFAVLLALTQASEVNYVNELADHIVEDEKYLDETFGEDSGIWTDSEKPYVHDVEQEVAKEALYVGQHPFAAAAQVLLMLTIGACWTWNFCGVGVVALTMFYIEFKHWKVKVKLVGQTLCKASERIEKLAQASPRAAESGSEVDIERLDATLEESKSDIDVSSN